MIFSLILLYDFLAGLQEAATGGRSGWGAVPRILRQVPL